MINGYRHFAVKTHKFDIVPQAEMSLAHVETLSLGLPCLNAPNTRPISVYY